MLLAASAERVQQVHCALLMLSELKFVRFTASSGPARALRRARVRLRYSVVSGMAWPGALDARMACSRPVHHAAAEQRGGAVTGSQVPVVRPCHGLAGDSARGLGALAISALMAAGCATACGSAAGQPPWFTLLGSSAW